MQKRYFALALLVLTLCACGDNTATPDDAGPSETSGPRDGEVLRACTSPGAPCAAHTSCAINPVCGDDLLCHPQSYQNCDDGLDCTEDTCLGQGKCENTPAEGACVLPQTVGGKTELRCFKKDDRSTERQCLVCDPDTAKKQWTPANGGACDDGNDCTKDDYCDNGTCRGTDYRAQCDDNISCTDDKCDGKGGCLGNTLRSDSCLINNQCYKDGDGDATGCNRCDVSKSQSQWTALTLHCLIANRCYMPGEKDATGCAECDPSKDPSGWTPLPNVCQIDGKCYSPGDKNTAQGGCAECDPTVSATSWTIKGTTSCYIDSKCHSPGDKDATGCAECVPQTSTTQWTPINNTCLIAGKCEQGGTVHPAGCAKCDPAQSTTEWTNTNPSLCLVNDKCEDKQTSVFACGACGAQCGAGETCVAGACVCGSASGTVGGGSVCGTGMGCENGACTNCTSTNVARQATATMSGGGTGSYGPANMIDGYDQAAVCAMSGVNFAWVSTSGGAAGKWIQLEWTTPQKIGRVFIDTLDSGNGCGASAGRNLAGGRLQYWQSGVWVDISGGAVSNLTTDWNVSFTPVTTTKLRVMDVQHGLTSNPVIYEWEAYCQ